MLGSLKKKFHPEKGQVVVFTVLLLPLILGVVVFVIEIGNIYVHYSDLQNVADTAAITGDPTKAKAVADVNSKNFSNKSVFQIETYKCPQNVNPNPEKFFVKLVKNMPMIFIKVFKPIQLNAYAAASSGKLVPITKAEREAIGDNWKLASEPEEP